MKKRFLKLFYIVSLAALLSAIYTAFALPTIKSKVENPSFLLNERPIFPIYLNAIFIQKDLSNLAWADSLFTDSTETEMSNAVYTVGRNGGKILKNTMGTSVMTLPAFTVAHLLAQKKGDTANGLSITYFVVYHWYGGLLLLIGWYLLWVVLSKYFTSAVKLVTLLAICAATYWADLWQVLDQLDLIYLFFLHSALLYAAGLFFEKPKINTGILVGLILGLTVLLRPVEIILILIPILWKVSPKIHHLKVRLYHIIKNYKSYLYLILSMSLLIAMQITYWIKYSGQAFVFNDQVIGVTRDISRLEAMMFGPKSGVFLYSPILIVMVLGFFCMKSVLFRIILPIFSVVLLIGWASINYYFWWNGGDSGSLYINQLYVFLALPFAALVDFCLKRLWSGILLWLTISILTFLNFWRIHDETHGKLLAPPDITYEYLKAAVLKDSLTDQMVKLLDTDVSFGENIVGDSLLIKKSGLFCLNAKVQYSKRWELKQFPDKKYFRFKLDAIAQDREPEIWKHAQMIVSYYKGSRNIGNDLLRIQRLLGGKTWHTIWLDSKVMEEAESIVISIWNADSTNEICFRNLQLIGFDGILQSSKPFKSLKK
ncbi:MAG TPA: hypothetical protein PKD18_13230 [Saprospiraceae bacterium]|nr:hypothetical protein [Saprospiraceae bacterium]